MPLEINDFTVDLLFTLQHNCLKEHNILAIKDHVTGYYIVFRIRLLEGDT